MVNAAIADMKDKKGSSLPAIKKYIVANYKGIQMVRAAPLIRRYLKKAIGEGIITQKQRSFRVSGEDETAKPAKKTTTKATKSSKKAATPKKSAKKPANRTPVKKMAKVAKRKTPTKKPAAKKLTKKPTGKKTTKK